jgi:hypothetical protein
MSNLQYFLPQLYAQHNPAAARQPGAAAPLPVAAPLHGVALPEQPVTVAAY